MFSRNAASADTDTAEPWGAVEFLRDKREKKASGCSTSTAIYLLFAKKISVMFSGYTHYKRGSNPENALRMHQNTNHYPHYTYTLSGRDARSM